MNKKIVSLLLSMTCVCPLMACSNTTNTKKEEPVSNTAQVEVTVSEGNMLETKNDVKQKVQSAYDTLVTNVSEENIDTFFETCIDLQKEADEKIFNTSVDWLKEVIEKEDLKDIDNAELKLNDVLMTTSGMVNEIASDIEEHGRQLCDTLKDKEELADYAYNKLNECEFYTHCDEVGEKLDSIYQQLTKAIYNEETIDFDTLVEQGINDYYSGAFIF